MNNLLIDGRDNVCEVGEKIFLTGFIKDNCNRIMIDNPKHECSIDISCSGNFNNITIKNPFAIKKLIIRIGNHVPAHSVQLFIDDGFSIEKGGHFLLDNSGNILQIGKGCMFSNTVTIRCGDSPHLIFDRITGDYLDVSDGVFIGDHVWVGERVYITKRASIPSECLVAACAVVTRQFNQTHAVVAGNPAKIVRENVQWIRNHSHLVAGSTFKTSYQARLDKFKEYL